MINVDCTLPGIVKTDLSRNAIPKFLEMTMILLSPIGKLTEPEDIASLAVFFASDITSDISV